MLFFYKQSFNKKTPIFFRMTMYQVGRNWNYLEIITITQWEEVSYSIILEMLYKQEKYALYNK